MKQAEIQSRQSQHPWARKNIQGESWKRARTDRKTAGVATETIEQRDKLRSVG